MQMIRHVVHCFLKPMFVLMNCSRARHTFILSFTEKKQIWETVGRLLVDNQVEVSFLMIYVLLVIDV